MPRLLLEGKSITELLAQVRAEHGDGVTIVAAEKVRSRGVGGFFARESYALTVEVDDEPAALNHVLVPEQAFEGAGPSPAGGDQPLLPGRAAAAQAPGTLLDLAAAIDAAEATENSVILATRPMHSATQEPALSTASPEFASILARLTALDAPAPATSPATSSAADPAPPADAYSRLREVLGEIAPHLDLGTSVPLVLVIAPSPQAGTTTVRDAAIVSAPAPAIPRQGRHRRARVDHPGELRDDATPAIVGDA